MTEDSIQKGKEFANYLENLSEEEKIRLSDLEIRKSEEEYQEFKTKFEANKCYLCNRSLNSFSKNNPCLHWFLSPKGFRKHDLNKIARKYGMLQIQSYLRWIANQEKFAANINDMKEEGTGNKLVEVTIRYKNLEWSISCGESDFNGHQNSKNAKHPHYHLQMRVDSRQFINFNDFHLPLSDMDIMKLEAMKTLPDDVKGTFFRGEGMADLFQEENLESIVNHTQSTSNSDGATFEFSSVLIAEEGKTISGDDVYKAIQEANAEGVSIASKLRSIPNANSRTIISPGDGVVEQKPRSKRKKR